MKSPRQSPREILVIKEAVRAREGHCCLRCGMTNEEHLSRYGVSLDVHRITPRSLYSLEACIALCKPCHGTQPKAARGQPDQAHGTFLLFARIRPDLGEAWEAYLASLRPRPSVVRALEAILEEYLGPKGFWHPPAEGQS